MKLLMLCPLASILCFADLSGAEARRGLETGGSPEPAVTSIAGTSQARPPAGRVRVVGHSLADDNGPFLGIGVSYFTALWRCKYDQPRLNKDLAFLAAQGFNYYRMFSMVGYNGRWDGLEIAPVTFTNRAGKRVEAWADYWTQLGCLIDLAFEKHRLRTQITIFADAQLMADKQTRLEHLRKLLTLVVRGREEKIMLLEVANEAWQNGFPGEQGIADLREFANYLNARTDIPVAITSNHGIAGGFEKTYAGSNADLATWHFSRDRGPQDGWEPVYDCWDFADRAGFPPVVSNEPIGPGSSVASEKEPIKLVMAAVFAYVAKLPAYVFHSQAGVSGKTQFEDTPGIEQFGKIISRLPPDLLGWRRMDGKSEEAPFRVFAAGQADRYGPETDSSRDGCVRNVCSLKGDRFVSVAIGIRPGGLEIQARQLLHFTAFDPLTGEAAMSADLQPGERLKLPAGPGALIIQGHIGRQPDR